jgi:hypothetical protein
MYSTVSCCAEVKGSIVLIPMCAIIAAFKLGIEELGVQITEPFSILPVSNLYQCTIVSETLLAGFDCTLFVYFASRLGVV